MVIVKPITESGSKILISPAPGAHDVEKQFIPYYGVKTILSLDQSAATSVANEIAAKKLPVNQIIQHIDPSNPTESARKVEPIIRNLNENQYPLLIHCQAGRDRSGFATALWLKFHAGYSPKSAIQTMQRYGYGTGGISDKSLEVLNYIIGEEANAPKSQTAEDIASDVIDSLFADDIVNVMRDDIAEQQSTLSEGATPPFEQQSFSLFLDPASGYPNGGNVTTANKKLRRLILKKISADFGGGPIGSPTAEALPFGQGVPDINSISDIDLISEYLWDRSSSSFDSEESEKQFKGTDAVRQNVVNIAESQIGEGAGKSYRKFFDGTVDSYHGDKRVYWCGIFALWVLHQAGILTDVKWPWGSSFLGMLPRTDNPKPGDLGYKDRLQHHSIIVDVDGDYVSTIDGDSTGGKVTGPNKQSKNNFRAFYSISKFTGEDVNSIQSGLVDNYNGVTGTMMTPPSGATSIFSITENSGPIQI